ncbi:MAG: ABC transporter ATP-binding protein [Candidatus Hadarchaeales archaeon]
MREPIVMEGLTKRYGGFLALDGLSLRVGRNEKVALLGPNGAGKTTALKLLCGLLRPSGGRAWLAGFDVVGEREEAVARAGIMVETPEFYPFLTPEETLRYLGLLRGMGGSRLEERMGEVLELVGLGEWRRTRIGSFSRGMKQRLALAQALLHDPPILLLDEPSSGLDPRGMLEFRRILERVGRRKTVLLASHLLTEVSHLCRRVAVLNQGRLVTYQPLSSLKRKYGSLERAYLRLTGGAV